MILDRSPGFEPQGGLGGQKLKFNFSEHGHVAYQIKWNHKCSNMVANILPAADPLPHPTLEMRWKGQNSALSEHGHVANPIKWNHECCNMVANSLPKDIPDPPPMGSKGQNSTFLEQGNVAYQIKGNNECSNVVASILPVDHPLIRRPSPSILGMRS